MLVDRIFKSRFDSLEFERETYIDTLLCTLKNNSRLFIHSGEQEEKVENCVEHPCTYIELIEKALIQFHGYVLFPCVLILCS
jgi:hypothetical protein